MLKLVVLRFTYHCICPAAAPMGETTTCGALINLLANVSVKKQPATGLEPLFIFIVPVVSLPLIDAEPPMPRTLGLNARAGEGPVKAMWFGTCRTELPLIISFVTVIWLAVTGPLN